MLSEKLSRKSVLNQALEVMIHLRDNAMFTEGDALEVLNMMKAEVDGSVKEADSAQLKSFFNRKNKPMRVGELLIRSGLLTETDVMNAVEEGLSTRRKIGQVLVDNGFISVDALEMPSICWTAFKVETLTLRKQPKICGKLIAIRKQMSKNKLLLL